MCHSRGNRPQNGHIHAKERTFVAFLLWQFPEATVRGLIEQYRIGTTCDGHTIFYQIDAQGRVRSGKIIPYNPETGHRIKDGSVPAAAWVHTRLNALHQLPDDWTLTQCLFGEHLLPLFPASTVALVESEKTAVICAAAFPDCIWLATGGKSQLGSRLSVLRGRHVIAFPDTDAYPAWHHKLTPLGFHVSKLLETNATSDERSAKIDIADWILASNQIDQFSYR